jgi:UDP-glucuronate 4-epimerase
VADRQFPSGTSLVTGGAGFIGSHVCEALLERGHRVVALDNLNAYYNPARKRANIDEVRAGRHPDGAFVFIDGDIRDSATLSSLFAGTQFDCIIHLAAMAGVRASIEDPGLYFDVNLVGSLNVLNAVIHAQPGRDNLPTFVLASTSSVYGNTSRLPFDEQDSCDRPLAPYAASKRAAEMLAYTYHHLYGLNVNVLRFFTVYGPRGRPDMMAYKVAESVYHGRAVPLFNNGRMWRDWTYVGDIVSGILRSAERRLGYQIFNLGRGQPVLLADFVRSIEDGLGRRANLVPAPAPDTDIESTHADISRAQQLLGYRPEVVVAEGVTRFLTWYRQAVQGETSTR